MLTAKPHRLETTFRAFNNHLLQLFMCFYDLDRILAVKVSGEQSIFGIKDCEKGQRAPERERFRQSWK